jgi:hypothetical protein
LDESAKKNQDVIRRFAWEIASISVHLEEIRLSGQRPSAALKKRLAKACLKIAVDFQD